LIKFPKGSPRCSQWCIKFIPYGLPKSPTFIYIDL
jgi:hypothetical protein